MKTFEIEVIETLSRIIKVKAKTVEEAIEKVQGQYDAGEIVLDSGDFDNMPVFQDINAENICYNCNK